MGNETSVRTGEEMKQDIINDLNLLKITNNLLAKSNRQLERINHNLELKLFKANKKILKLEGEK